MNNHRLQQDAAPSAKPFPFGARPLGGDGERSDAVNRLNRCALQAQLAAILHMNAVSKVVLVLPNARDEALGDRSRGTREQEDADLTSIADRRA